MSPVLSVERTIAYPSAVASMSGSEDGETLLKKYSWEEIKSHQSPESLWVVVHDKVYDVTKFMDEVCELLASRP